jgi:hypothetical protein
VCERDREREKGQKKGFCEKETKREIRKKERKIRKE